jgi:hypothetical protein
LIGMIVETDLEVLNQLGDFHLGLCFGVHGDQAPRRRLARGKAEKRLTVCVSGGEAVRYTPC